MNAYHPNRFSLKSSIRLETRAMLSASCFGGPSSPEAAGSLVEAPDASLPAGSDPSLMIEAGGAVAAPTLGGPSQIEGGPLGEPALLPEEQLVMGAGDALPTVVECPPGMPTSASPTALTPEEIAILESQIESGDLPPGLTPEDIGPAGLAGPGVSGNGGPTASPQMIPFDDAMGATGPGTQSPTTSSPGGNPSAPTTTAAPGLTMSQQQTLEIATTAVAQFIESFPQTLAQQGLELPPEVIQAWQTNLALGLEAALVESLAVLTGSPQQPVA